MAQLRVGLMASKSCSEVAIYPRLGRTYDVNRVSYRLHRLLKYRFHTFSRISDEHENFLPGISNLHENE